MTAGMLVRAGAWGCIVLLVYLSLIPGNLQVRTALGGVWEHLFAYSGTATLFALSHPRRRFRIILGLTALGATLELLQGVVPGREPAALTALANAIGAVLGAMLTWVAIQFPRMRWPGGSEHPGRP